MAYNAFAGSFNIDSSVTAGNDQSITGVGFQPKVVIFWWSGGDNTVDEVVGDNIDYGIGAAISSTSRFCCRGLSADAVGTSDADYYQVDSHVIGRYVGGSLDRCDFKSMDADGFTLTMDTQFDYDLRVSFLALGGDDLTDYYIGNKQRDGDTGNCAVTGVGFQPDAVLLASSWYTAAAGGGANAQLSVGLATGSSNQGTISSFSQNGQATSNTSGYGYDGEVLALLFGSQVSHRDAFVSMDADGFTLNQLEGTTQYYYHYLCLGGGQYEVGDLTTRTDGNDIEVDLAGSFEPVAVLFLSANRALSTQDTATAHNRVSIGAATATDERCTQAVSDENGLATTECAYTNQDDAVYAHVVDDAIEALMDIKSFDADGFTCVMDDTESSACWVTYLAIGAEAQAGGEPLSIGIYPDLAAYTVNAPFVVG